MKNGKLKKGYSEKTGKDGKVRYMTNNVAPKKKAATVVGNAKKSTPKSVKSVSKDVKPKNPKEPKSVKIAVSKKKIKDTEDASIVEKETQTES